MYFMHGASYFVRDFFFAHRRRTRAEQHLNHVSGNNILAVGGHDVPRGEIEIERRSCPVLVVALQPKERQTSRTGVSAHCIWTRSSGTAQRTFREDAKLETSSQNEHWRCYEYFAHPLRLARAPPPRSLQPLCFALSRKTSNRYSKSPPYEAAVPAVRRASATDQ